MKKTIIFCTMLAIASINAVSQNRSINFETGTFAEAKEKAKKENKMIFIDFYTVWCGPCKWMEKNVYTNDTVADFYNKNFICLKIDAEKGEGIDLRKLYKVNAFPMFIFTNNEGKMLHQACGVHQPKDFIALGKDALSPDKQISKLILQYEKRKKDSDFVLKLLDAMSSASMSIDSIKADYFSNQKDEDIFLENNWKIIDMHVNDFDSKEFQFLLKNQAKFSDLYKEPVDSNYGGPVSKKIYWVCLSRARSIMRDKPADKEEKFLDLKEQIKKIDFEKKDQLLVEIDLEFFDLKKDKESYIKLASSGVVEKYLFNYGNLLNNIAWYFFENTDDTILLNKALVWAKRSVELSSDHYNNDTYANLLFKVGRKDEAIEYEKNAIKMAKEQGDRYEDYMKTLEKFQK